MKKKLAFLAVPISLFFLYVIIDTGPSLSITKLPTRKEKEIDWKAENQKTVKLLQKLIKAKTIRGNEILAVNILVDFFAKEGIQTRTIPMGGDKNRPILIAILSPQTQTKEKGLIFANHLDVVEANAEEWKVPPFEGKIVDNRIYGRGAIDMKGMAAMEAVAFSLIKRMKIKLKRPLMYLALPDEESGGGGAKFMAINHKEMFKNYQWMINEGGIGTDGVAIPNTKMFNIQYAEKGSLWLKVKANGKSGHGSSPAKNYALSDLIEFLKRVQNMEKGVTITKETESFFYQLGEASKFPNSFFLKRAANFFIKPIISGVIKKNRHLRAMTSNTRSLTGVQTPHSGINVISGEATGTIDMRLLPGVDPMEYFARLKELGKDLSLSMTIVEKATATSSPISSKAFQTLASVVLRNRPEATISPLMSPGLTDSTIFRRIGLECYGLIPGLFNALDIEGMHGKNENISIDNLEMGTKILYEFLEEMNL